MPGMIFSVPQIAQINDLITLELQHSFGKCFLREFLCLNNVKHDAIHSVSFLVLLHDYIPKLMHVEVLKAREGRVVPKGT